MSTLEKARWSSDSGIKCHFKQYLETIMQSYFWNVKYLLPRCVHLVRLAANRINLWFPFHLLSHFLPGWVSCKSVELTPLFCFVSGSGICLCFIFPLPLNKKSKPVCLQEYWLCWECGIVLQRSSGCNVITQRGRVPSEGAWCAMT